MPGWSWEATVALIGGADLQYLTPKETHPMPDPEFRNDGPHDPDLTRAAADKIAELTRYLAYATRESSGGLVNVGDAYDLAGYLAAAAGSLPQVLSQLDRFVTGLDEAGRLRSASDDTVPELAAGFALDLGYADGYARSLASRLHGMQNFLADLGMKEAPDGS
jgi:hypothetical protein